MWLSLHGICEGHMPLTALWNTAPEMTFFLLEFLELFTYEQHMTT